MEREKLSRETVVKLQSIKAFVASVSGVLNNNQDIIGQIDGLAFRGFQRSHYDGQGVSLLRATGVRVAFVTTEDFFSFDPVTYLVDRWNSLPSSAKCVGTPGWPHVELIQGVVGEEQILPVQDWLKGCELTFNDCAIMGHDLVQIPLMRRGVLRIAPAQAEEVAKRISHIVTPRAGGNGALRDFVNMVLEARGIDPTTLPTR